MKQRSSGLLKCLRTVSRGAKRGMRTLGLALVMLALASAAFPFPPASVTAADLAPREPASIRLTDIGESMGIQAVSPDPRQWVVRYNGTGNAHDGATAMALDRSGNVYVTGNSNGAGTEWDITTVKYDARGNRLWVARFNGPIAWGEDWARAIAVDASGNVYVTGADYGLDSGTDFVTLKYDYLGNQIWVARYSSPGSHNDDSTAITVDASGNVYVAGPSNGNDYDYATVKYDSAGNQLWVATYNGPANWYDYPKAIAVDASGNVYVTGGSENGPTGGSDYATIKYDSSGNQLWVARYNGPGNKSDTPTSLALDSSGNIYVTGSSMGAGLNADYATVKYDGNGNELWVARYNNGNDAATALALDASGNVYVTGWSTGLATDFATVKYDSAGNQEWVRRFNGPGNGDDQALAVAVDAAGSVYVMGQVTFVTDNLDYAVIKYAANGDALWGVHYNGPGNGQDYPLALAIDGESVYATGASFGGNTTDFDYATVKVPASGPIVPGITVVSPNGGESWEVGSAQHIKWTSIGISGTVDIDVSRDGGATWKRAISSVAASAGDKVWTVSGSSSTQARIRVSNRSYSDASNTDFTILAPGITVTSPNGDETFQIGSTAAVTWNSVSLPAKAMVKIEESRDSGTTWKTIFPAVPNSGSKTWTVTGPSTSRGRVRVSIGTAGASDASNADFTILPPTITVTTPVGGESVQIGDFQTINWDSVSLPSKAMLKIEMSRDGGTTWKTLFPSVPNTGTKTWVVTGPATSLAKVRVSNTSAGASDASDANFTILPSAIAVSSPNGGETWAAGTTQTITWSSQSVPPSAKMKIEVSRDGGATWKTIVASTPNSGSVTWTVSGSTTSHARVRVGTGTTPFISDTSDADFNIS